MELGEENNKNILCFLLHGDPALNPKVCEYLSIESDNSAESIELNTKEIPAALPRQCTVY